MLDSFTHTQTEKQRKDKFQITSRHLTRLYSHFLRNWLTEICHQNKRKTLPVQFTLRLKLRCGMHNNESENVVLAKVQRCEESFIGTFVKRGSLPAFTGSAGDQLSRSVTLSEVSGFCQVFWHPASVVLWEMELLRVFFLPPHPPKKTGMEKKITASVSTLRVWI